MISSAICDQSVRAHRESANFSLWRNLRVLIHPKLHSKSCDYLLMYACKKSDSVSLFSCVYILSWIAGSAAFVGLVLEVVRPLSQAQVLLL